MGLSHQTPPPLGPLHCPLLRSWEKPRGDPSRGGGGVKGENMFRTVLEQGPWRRARDWRPPESQPSPYEGRGPASGAGAGDGAGRASQAHTQEGQRAGQERQAGARCPAIPGQRLQQLSHEGLPALLRLEGLFVLRRGGSGPASVSSGHHLQAAQTYTQPGPASNPAGVHRHRSLQGPDWLHVISPNPPAPRDTGFFICSCPPVFFLVPSHSDPHGPKPWWPATPLLCPCPWFIPPPAAQKTLLLKTQCAQSLSWWLRR